MLTISNATSKQFALHNERNAASSYSEFCIDCIIDRHTDTEENILQKQRYSAYQNALVKGKTVPIQYLKCYLVGIPQIGKTGWVLRYQPRNTYSNVINDSLTPLLLWLRGISSSSQLGVKHEPR